MSRFALLALLGVFTALPAAAVDLAVTAVSGPTSAKAGALVTVSNTVAAATGGGNAGAFRVGLYLSSDATITTADELIGFRQVASLAAGKSSTATTVALIPPNRTGRYWLGAIADDLGALAETNEGNNARAAAAAISVTGPDLTISSVTGPTSAAPGATIQVGTTVANAAGAGAAGHQRVGIYLSTDAVITTADRLLGTREILLMLGGGTSAATTGVTLPAGLVGTFYLGAIADDAGWVTESNEANNAKAGPAITITGPDLAIAATGGPAWALPGAAVTVSAQVQAGSAGGPAGTWYVDFYLQPAAAPVVPDPQRRVARYTGTATLAAGARLTVTAAGAVPPGVGPGLWYLAAVVSGATPDANPANDALATATLDVSRLLSGVADGAVLGAVPVALDWRRSVPGAASVTAWLDGAPLSGAAGVTSEGDHQAVAEARDASGALLGRETVRFSIDLSAPTIQVSGVADGQVTAAASLAPAFSAADPHLAGVTARLDGQPFASGALVTAEGEHTLVVEAADVLGHAATRTLRFALDRTPPVITVAGVAPGQVAPPPLVPVFQASDAHLVEVVATLDGAAFLSGTPVGAAGPHLLQVRASDAAGLVATLDVPFTVVGDTAAPDIQVFGIAPGEVSPRSPTDVCVAVSDPNLASWSAALDGLPVGGCFSVWLEGDHELTVVAADTYGHVATRTIGFALDFSPPQLSVGGVADGQVLDAAAVAISYAMLDAHPAGLTATLDGAAFPSGGAVSAEGAHWLVVTGSDRAGHVSELGVHFTLDRTAPAVSVAGVSDGQVSRSPLSPVVTASDATLATVEVRLDGQPFAAGATVGAEGPHELVASATDRAGHATSVTVRFRIDTTPPTVTVEAPPPGQLLQAAQVEVVARASDAGGLSGVTADGVPLQRAADGLWRGVVPLVEGANLVTVTASDLAGLAAVATVPVTRDTLPPTLLVSTPAQGAVLASGAVAVSGTVADAHAVRVTVGGVEAAVAGGAFSAGLALGEGPQTLVVVATDAAGNTTSAARDVTVDLTSPVIQVTGVTDGLVSRAASLAIGFTVEDATLESAAATLDGAPFGSGGTVSAEGSHELRVSARDRAGHAAERVVRFALDRTAPLLLVSGVSDGLVSDVAVTPVVEASDPHLVGLAITLDGAPFASGTTVTADGLHLLVATAADAAGNERTVTVQFTIAGDVAPPTILITGVADGEVTGRNQVDVCLAVTDPSLPTWTAALDGLPVPDCFSVWLEGDHELVVTATDARGNATTRRVAFAIDLTDPVIDIAGATDGLVSRAASLTLAFSASDLHLDQVHGLLDGPEVASPVEVTAEGAHALDVVATDRAGHTATRRVSFTLDRTPPEVTISGLVDGQVVRPPASPAFGATDARLAGVVAHLDGQPYVSGAPITADGPHTLVVTATDTAGNEATATVAFRVDGTPPALAVTAPAPGSLVAAADVAVVASATDASRVTAVTANGAPLSLEGDGAWRGRAPVVEGAGEVVVVATDEVGNQAIATVAVVRDTVPPTLTVTSPEEGNFLADGAVQVAGAVDDASAVTLTVNGAPVAVQAGSFGTTVTLAEGARTVTVVATDAAGNATTLQRQVVVDLTDPAIEVAGVGDGQVTSAASVALTWTASDANLGAVAATLDGAPFEPGGVVSAEGPHTLLVTALDRAGRQAQRPWSFVLDRQAPTVVVAAPAAGATLGTASVEVVASVTEAYGLVGVSANGVALAQGTDGQWRAAVPLSEGPNAIAVAAQDVAGNGGGASVQVRRDMTAPALVVTSPGEGQVTQSGQVAVAGSASDASGVVVTVNGGAVPVAADGGFQVTLDLPYGDHAVVVVARDPLGHEALEVRHVQVRGGPLKVTIAEPLASFVTTAATTPVRGTVSGGAGGWSVTAAGVPLPVAADGSYAGQVPLAVGSATIAVVATDAAGATASASVSGRRSEPGTPTPEPGAADPVLVLESPAAGAVFGGPVPVSGSISGGTPPYQVSALGVRLATTGASFGGALALAEGDQLLTVEVSDAAGRRAVVQRAVAVDRTAPWLVVTRPATSPAEVGESPYLVEGQVGDLHLSSVTVAGQAATVAGGLFAVPVSLTAGVNDVEVVATDLVGNATRRSVSLRVRAMPPVVTVLAPLDGAVAASAVVRVQARVEATSDLVSVTIGSAAARLEGGLWVADVALALGENLLQVAATDASGLSGSATVRVRWRDVSEEPLAVVGVSPAAGAGDVESGALVSVSFNKAVRRDGLAGHFTVSAGGAPLPGGFYVAPGEQTVSFVAHQPLPEGQRVVVAVSGLAAASGRGQEQAFESQFTVRPRRTRVHGNVVDDQLRPVPGVQVSVVGTGFTTRTGPEGSWHLFGLPAGAVVVQFEGGLLGEGQGFPIVRRRLFVEGARDTHDDLLQLVPVDGASATPVDARAAVHATFGGRHGPLALDVPSGGLFFEDGKTAGLVTATWVPSFSLPVPIENGRFAGGAMWQLGPPGVRFTRPVELTFPNATRLPAGRYVVVMGYDPERHMVVRAGVGRVAADGASIRTHEPVEVQGLDFFGYSHVTDEQQLALLQLLDPAAAPAPAPSGAGAKGSGTTGSLGPVRPSGARLLDLLLSPFKVQPAWAGIGLGVGGPLGPIGVALGSGEPAPGYAEVRGKVRSPQERLVQIDVPTGLLTETTLELPVQHPVTFVARADADGAQVQIAMRARRGAAEVSPPAKEDWGQEKPIAGAGQATVSGTVQLEPGTTLITAEALQARDSRTARLEAVLTELPPEPDPTTGKPVRRGKLQVRRLVETEASAASAGVSFFANWPVTAQGATRAVGVTGSYGQFNLPIFSYGSQDGATVCTDVQTGLRWIVQADATDPAAPKLVRYPIVDGFPVCQTVWGLAPGSSSPVSLLVDMRLLTGSINFYNRDDRPVPGACSPGAGTRWSEATKELESISQEDVGKTEVYFFREDDLTRPIARYVMAVPPSEQQCSAAGAYHGEYKRLRFGPSERWTRRDRETCEQLELAGNTSDYFYRYTCEGRERQLELRLSEGDHLVVAAVNHATGYAGATTVVVPPITTRAGLDADGKCALDEQMGGPIEFTDFGQTLTVSRCAQQDIRVPANLRLYPPEVDVRVSRQLTPEGASPAPEIHLVRHGGAATVRDDLLYVSTHWRVRLPPADLDSDGTPNLSDACPSQAGPPETFGCPDPARPGWEPPPRPPVTPVAPPPLPPVNGPTTGGEAWPYNYLGNPAGPAVDPFDADGDGIPDLVYDRDGDGTPDAADRCPTVRGVAAAGGCPAGADRDGDGTPDVAELPGCVDVPGPLTTGGCPDPGQPGWTPSAPAALDSDRDGVPDDQDLCPYYPGADGTDGLRGCPSLLSRFDTDEDGVPDTEDECVWSKGPRATFGCPDPADAGWIPPEPPPAIPGGPGKVLERYCSELVAPTLDELKVCRRMEDRLMDMPAGVPPLAAQLVQVTGAASAPPQVAVFPVEPGKKTGNVQAALRINNPDARPADPAAPEAAKTLTVNLPRADYYLHVVGNLTLFNDLDGDGRIDLATEVGVAPPAFQEKADGSGKPGQPEFAVALKNVYRSREPDGTVLERFDRDREHEFRVLETKLQEVTAAVGGGTRRVDQSSSGKDHAAQEGDLSYQMLLQLLAPETPGRAGTLPGAYQVRFGSDDMGVDCQVKQVGELLTATCDGGWLYDVLSGRDLVYIGLSMTGNAENILYKYNLQGLSPRRDLVTAGHLKTTEKSLQDDAGDLPALLRAVGEPALANVFVGPNHFKHGQVQICAGSCGDVGILREFEATWLEGGGFTITETVAPGGTAQPRSNGAMEQVPNFGVAGSSLFRIPIPPSLVKMPGWETLERGWIPNLLVRFKDLDDPNADWKEADLGQASGAYQGANARAPGQSGAGGVNVADGHVSFRHEDFSLPELAGRVRFARTYNNQDNEIGTLGVGWRHNFEAYVVEERLGRYTMVLEGQSYDFPTCKTIDRTAKSAEECQTDASHGGKLTVKERPEANPAEPKHAPDVVFEAPNGVRYRFDRWSQRALQSVSLVDRYRTAAGVSAQADYQERAGLPDVIKTDAGTRQIREAGRRRWVLTAIDDGHGRADPASPTDPTKPGPGWTVVDYFADSDMIRRVYRKGGRVVLDFDYEAVDATSVISPRFKAAAMAENFGLLRTVTARHQRAAGDGVAAPDTAFVVQVTYARSTDQRGNLASASRVAEHPDRRAQAGADQVWDYGYVQDLQSLKSPGKDLSSQDLWEATNEIEQAELRVYGTVQWRTKWTRRLSWPGWAHQKRFEIVDQVVLPGTSTVGPPSASGDGLPVERPLLVDWVQPKARKVTRPDGVMVDVDLNEYGNVTAEAIAGAGLATDWFSNVEGGKVQPSAATTAGGRKLSFESTDRLLPSKVSLSQAGNADTLPAAVGGLGATGKALWRGENHHERFGVAQRSVLSTASGYATRDTPYDDQGNRISERVDEGSETLLRTGDDTFDPDGVPTTVIDPAGRVTTWSEQRSPFGQPQVSTTRLTGPAPGGLGATTRTLEHDWLGRVTRSTDDLGHEEQWEYDAVGRLTRHRVEGTPAQEWTYRYAGLGDRELQVTEQLTGSGHRRVSTYRDGLLVEETWQYGEPARTARRTQAYQGGRLDVSVDERGVTRTHRYDGRGRLEVVEATDPKTDARREEVRYQRDDEGKVTQETDQNGLVTRLKYDELGQVARWERPSSLLGGDTVSETLVRDPNGMPVRRTHGNFEWEFSPDALARVREVRNRSGGELRTVTRYDGLGRKTRVEDVILGLVEEWDYQDVLGRPTEHRRTVAPRSETFKEVFRYVDLPAERRVEVEEYLGSERTKRRTTWLDAMGRPLQTREFVVQDGVDRAADRYVEYDVRGNEVARREPVGDGPTEATAAASTATTAVTRRSYDAAGNLTAVVDPAGHATRYTHDAGGLVVGQRGPQPGEQWTFEHDQFGQLTRKALERGDDALAGWQPATWTYRYGLIGGATVEEVDPGGYTTQRWYNAGQQLLQEIRSDMAGVQPTANERKLTVTWDGPFARVQLTEEGAWRETITRAFDHRGRVTSEDEWFTGQEPTAGYRYTTSIPWSGRTAAVTQSWLTSSVSGSRTGHRTVDALGNVIELSWGAFTDEWSYDAAGRLEEERPLGKPVRSHRYEEGLLVEEVLKDNLLEERTRHQYWASGKPRATVTPDLRTRKLTWDVRGLLALEEYGAGVAYNVTGYGYDPAGNRSSMTVAAGPDQALWAYQVGPRQELLSVTQPAPLGIFKYAYDARALLVGITPPVDGASAEQEFRHDYLGRMVKRRRGDVTWTTTWVAGAGTTTEPEDPSAVPLRPPRSSTRALDGRGREAVAFWSGAPSDLTRVEREFSPLDRPLRIEEKRVSGNVRVDYAYEQERQLLTGITRGAEAVGYGYTTSGELEWEQTPSGRVTYGYEALDRLRWVTAPGGRTTEVSWEEGGARLRRLKAPDVTECRSYDLRGRLARVASVDPSQDPACETTLTPLAAFEYGYDERGNRLSERYLRTGQPDEVTEYGYDKADRLWRVVHPDGAETVYGLGGDGSRITEQHASIQGGVATSLVYGYDPRGGLTSITGGEGGPVTFGVDLAGRVTSETRPGSSKTFDWDAGGRLASVTVTTGGSSATSSYRYDHAGRRIRKQGPAGVTSYLWGAGDLAEEILPGGARLRYERMGGMALAVGGQTLLHDGLGSVVGRMVAGSPVHYRYDPWGNFQGTPGPGASQPSLAYAGQHWDSDAGLSYAQQRWYEPRVGRFLSEDPVGASDERLREPGRLASFAYAAGSPLRFIDPLGLDVGQPESTSARAQEEMRFQANLNESNKDRGNWAQGCAAGLADNWKNVDGGAMEAGYHSPEYLAGYVKCQGANLDWYRNSDIAKNTREYWQDSQVMGCALGGGNAIIPAGDVSNLPPEMQEAAAACQFGVGAATAVMTVGEFGVSGYRAVKNFRPSSGPRPAFATVGAEGRAVVRAEEASAASKAPVGFESRATAGTGASAEGAPKLLTAGANAPDKTVRHHIFNKFRGESPRSQKYRDFFKRHGIEVDKWTVEIPRELHKDWIHKADQNWTTRWKQWIDANPNATTKEVYQFGGQLMDEFGLSRQPLVPYR